MKHRPHGFSLIELMVTLLIGSVLIAGAVFVYAQSQRTHRVSEATARLQENARYVLSILEPDIQLAGYYGFSNLPGTFWFTTGGSSTTMVSSARMAPTEVATPGLAGAAHVCGNNFAVNLLATVEGSNNAYTLDCAATPGPVRPNTDSLTLRRASTTVAPVAAGRLQLITNRISAEQLLLASGNLPDSLVGKLNPATGLGTGTSTDMIELRNLVVRSYFISNNSDGRIGVPSLRRKELATGPTFVETEVMSGVEDLQVQFGIDTGDYDGNGAIDADQDEDPADGVPDYPSGLATRYVNPDALPAGFQVVAVRLWLLMRAEQAEQGFTDNRAYLYADKVVPAPNDGFRRVLVSRTIHLRNARIL